ncbi:MAG: phosphoribosylaminoimidazolesuccinocarboxamide synthase [Acidobacteriota bacterium]|nr:phosphoribosylaminoimidazolesuccinocarboxamide synthase [Acidobacteriota bacterium]
MPGVPLHARGKVRDIYEAGEFLVLVASDRLSAFDYILPTPIPNKGRVLTQLTIFWLGLVSDILPNHLVTTDVSKYPEPFPQFRDQLTGRSMLVRRARMIDVECVARGYVSGSGWKDYQRTGEICGIPLPAGLRESSRLPEPIFTPASKAHSGHDENISFEVVAERIGTALAVKLRSLTLQIYSRASEYAESRGILLADTKFEFGFVDGELILADEVLTPDSSRFWPKDTYQPGGPQSSYDKQYVRDYLESIGWNKQPPAPELPPEVVSKTSAKYIDAYQVLTGKAL